MRYPVIDLKATGSRIKERRKEKHLTVSEVAEFMGFESLQAVYKWQRGDSLPTVDKSVCPVPIVWYNHGGHSQRN